MRCGLSCACASEKVEKTTTMGHKDTLICKVGKMCHLSQKATMGGRKKPLTKLSLSSFLHSFDLPVLGKCWKPKLDIKYERKILNWQYAQCSDWELLMEAHVLLVAWQRNMGTKWCGGWGWAETFIRTQRNRNKNHHNSKHYSFFIIFYIVSF